MPTVIEKKLHSARVLARAGVLRPVRPDHLVRLGVLLARYGPTPAAGVAAAAMLRGPEPALIDDLGLLSFTELHRRSSALAAAFADRGVREGQTVALLARNHRYFVEATVACSKLGANVLYLNTAFAAPQAAQVLERERPTLIVYDAELADLVAEAAAEDTERVVAFPNDDGAKPPHETLEEMISMAGPRELAPPAESGRTIILTSGTTGAPKGAGRSRPDNLDPVAAFIDRVPMHARERTLIAAPLFHAWGAAHMQLGLSLESTFILQRHFDPEETLAAIHRHHPTALAVVPVMLQRLLNLPEEVRARYDTSSLRVVAASGSAISGALAERFMNAFGDVLYNLYGSTEIGWASIATPRDLRVAPGTAGRAPYGTRLVILDDKDRELPPGATGRIFVRHDMLFDGYTDGRSKELVDGMMSAGDVGHLDPDGRLFVDAREDDMIVSGGENVYPGEVEELLAGHPVIEEAAVVGVPDEEFGERLRAYVVRARGESIDADDVRAFVKERLARYKVPRDVEFVEELPRNATGKVLKRELA